MNNENELVGLWQRGMEFLRKQAPQVDTLTPEQAAAVILGEVVDDVPASPTRAPKPFGVFVW